MTAAIPQARPRQRWIWVLVALATALALIGTAGLRVALKAAIEHATMPAVVYHRDPAQLQVVDPGGSVSVSPSPPGQVRVAATVRWLGARPVVRRSWRGRDLSVVVGCPAPDLFGDCQANLDISVPAGTRLVATAGAGELNVTGLTGSVDAQVSSGTVTLADVSGPVLVRVGAGSVSGTGLSSRQLGATANSGEVSLAFTAPPQVLALTVGTGSAAATVPPGAAYRVVRRPGSGSVTLASGLSVPGSARVLTVQAGQGSVSVGYPPGG